MLQMQSSRLIERRIEALIPWRCAGIACVCGNVQRS